MSIFSITFCLMAHNYHQRRSGRWSREEQENRMIPRGWHVESGMSWPAIAITSIDVLWPLTWRNGFQEERTIWSQNIPADAILNAKKCQSWNNHNVIVLSLFTEISVIALHSNSIFKVHCASKMLQFLNSYFLIQVGGRWEVFELYEKPHETFQQYLNVRFQHPAYSFSPKPKENTVKVYPHTDNTNVKWA